jgi:hypothetical protein
MKRKPLSQVSLNTMEILEQWDLLADKPDLAQYTMSNWRDLAHALQKAHEGPLPQVLGGTHMGLAVGSSVAEGGQGCDRISLPLVLSDVIWLPDPAYNLLVPQASEAWRDLPESGSTVFAEKPGVHVQWKGLWDVQRDAEFHRSRTSQDYSTTSRARAANQNGRYSLVFLGTTIY